MHMIRDFIKSPSLSEFEVLGDQQLGSPVSWSTPVAELSQLSGEKT